MKVVDDAEKVQMQDGKPMEAALTEGLTHPAICRLYAHALRSHSRVSSDEWQRENRGIPHPDELWLLLEYCDKGCVQVRPHFFFITFSLFVFFPYPFYLPCTAQLDAIWLLLE